MGETTSHTGASYDVTRAKTRVAISDRQNGGAPDAAVVVERCISRGLRQRVRRTGVGGRGVGRNESPTTAGR